MYSVFTHGKSGSPVSELLRCLCLYLMMIYCVAYFLHKQTDYVEKSARCQTPRRTNRVLY